MTEKMTIEQFRATIMGVYGKPKKKPDTSQGDENKARMGWGLIDLSRRLNLILVKEYRFNPKRRWRADWALFGRARDREIKILIEYEGLSARKTGHTTSEGYTANAEKYNDAQIRGWIVLRYTYRSFGKMTVDLYKIINGKTDDDAK